MFNSQILCSIDWSAFASLATSLVAISISIVALKRNSKYSKKNIDLSIKQAIFKMVQEKARDCNVAWKNEPENENNDGSPHFLIVTEFIVAIEVIGKAFDLFANGYLSPSEDKASYHYLYWKQLLPDVRGFIMERTQSIAKNVDSKIYTRQISIIHEAFGEHFEKR